MGAGKILLLICGFYFIISTLLSFLKTKNWNVRQFGLPGRESFWMQVSTLILFMIFFFRNETWEIIFSGVLFISALTQAILFFPLETFGKITRESIRAGKAFRIYISFAGNENSSEKIVAQVRESEPDLVILFETDNLRKDHLSEIRDLYNYNLKEKITETSEVLFFSRTDFFLPQVRLRKENEDQEQKNEITLPAGARFNFYGPGKSKQEKNSFLNLELILAGKESIPEKSGTVTKKPVSRIRTLTHLRGGSLFSFLQPSRNYIFRWAMDHILVSREFQLREIKRLGSIGSGHLPVLVDLTWETEVSWKMVLGL